MLSSKHGYLFLFATICIGLLVGCGSIKQAAKGALVDFAVDSATASAEINTALSEQSGNVFVMPEDHQLVAYVRDFIQFETDVTRQEILTLYEEEYGAPIGVDARNNPIFDHDLFGPFALSFSNGQIKKTSVTITPGIPVEQE